MHKNHLWLLFISGLLLWSCASRRELESVRDDAAYLRSQIVSLQAEQARLKQAILNLKSVTEQYNETVFQYQADTRQQLRELSRENRILNDRIADLLRRFSGVTERYPDSAVAAAETEDTTSFNAEQSKEQADNLFRSAYQDLVRGNYELARQGFQRYLEQYSGSDKDDDARYWIGESFYARQQYSPAIAEFQEVISRYPRGDKVGAALLKLGYSQIAVNRISAGRETLENLIRQFPDSNEASLARARLQELK